MLNQYDYSDEFWYRAKHKEIRWSHWVATRYIHIYEAVLLSLDLDPERICYPDRRWANELNSRDRLSLDERVEIIEGYMGSGKPFDTDETFLNYKVDLRYFSQVLTDNFLPIPEILKKYVIEPSELVIAIKAEREEYLVDQDYLSKKAGVISGEAVLTRKELIRRELEDNRKKVYKETKYQYADEIKQIKKENEELKARVAELEQVTLIHPSLNPKHKNHAPELLLAIQSWEAKYLENEYPHQEHTPAITKILESKNVKQVNLVKRICAITNPKK